MKLSIKQLITISRSRFWIYLLGPYLLGVLAAVQTIDQALNPKLLLLALFFTLPANLLVYGINDIFDRDTDQINTKKQGYEAALERRTESRLGWIILFFNIPFLITLYWLPAVTIWAMVGFYFFAIFYSSPPIRAKAIPFLDSAFNILYVFPALVGYFAAGGAGFDWRALIGGWFWVMAMHAYSAIPDIEADAKAGIHTIATKLGKHKTLLFCTIAYGLSAIFAYTTIGWPAIPLGTVYIAMMFASHKADAMMPLYKLFPVINTSVGAVLFWLIAQKFIS